MKAKEFEEFLSSQKPAIYRVNRQGICVPYTGVHENWWTGQRLEHCTVPEGRKSHLHGNSCRYEQVKSCIEISLNGSFQAKRSKPNRIDWDSYLPSGRIAIVSTYSLVYHSARDRTKFGIDPNPGLLEELCNKISQGILLNQSP